jgi:hypothetical protein
MNIGDTPPASTDFPADAAPSASATTLGGAVPLVGPGLLFGATMPFGATLSQDANAPLELQARMFEALLSYNPSTDDSLDPRANTPHTSADLLLHGGPVDVASLLAASQPISNTAPAVAAAAADPEPTFAELIERHVRRTLATRPTNRYDSEEVRLELTDAILPDTSLSLRRSSAGWQLTAITNDRGSLERLEQFTPSLVKRFANASLGSLEVVARLENPGLAGHAHATPDPTQQSTPGR